MRLHESDMGGQGMSLQDQKSDAKVMPKVKRDFGKTDVRYWASRIFRRARHGDADSHWTAQIQHLGEREQFPLNTPNKAAAATTAREIYLNLQALGWEKTRDLYKPKIKELLPKDSTVGDLIREVGSLAHYRSSTFAVYCSALRKISADIASVKSDKSRFGPKAGGSGTWREKVDKTPLDSLSSVAVQQWKLRHIQGHSATPEEHSRAINTVNAHLRNARSLFTPKALEFAKARLALPTPLPFAGIKLEKRRATTRYSSRMDPSALLMAAKTELGENPESKTQFVIFCLALLCGLRKREIDTLLWRSVDFEKAVIRIERTKYFQPKSEDSGGDVDIAPELATILKKLKEKAKSEFVIESVNPPRYETSRANYRAEADFIALYAWLEGKGIKARKKLHELRKECGSMIANSQGIFAASRALRHSDIRITAQYYSDKKIRITTGIEGLLK